MYTDQLREDISQGDILLDVPIAYVGVAPEGQQPPVKVISGPAMVVTRDCEYDKKKSFYAMVVKVTPLSTLPVDQQSIVRGEVADKKVIHMLYLPEVPGRLPESYADLRTLDRVGKPYIESLKSPEKRVVSLTDEGRLSLQSHIAVFFGLEAPSGT